MQIIIVLKFIFTFFYPWRNTRFLENLSGELQIPFCKLQQYGLFYDTAGKLHLYTKKDGRNPIDYISTLLDAAAIAALMPKSAAAANNSTIMAEDKAAGGDITLLLRKIINQVDLSLFHINKIHVMFNYLDVSWL